PLVFVAYCTPVTSFTATTSASFITLLAGSDTRPLMFAFGDCANSGRRSVRTQMRERTSRGKHILALRRRAEFAQYSVYSLDFPSRLHGILSGRCFRARKNYG